MCIAGELPYSDHLSWEIKSKDPIKDHEGWGKNKWKYDYLQQRITRLFAPASLVQAVERVSWLNQVPT